MEKPVTKYISSIFCFALILFLMPKPGLSQIYYVSDDTLWVQENSAAEPVFIAEGSSLPIQSVAVDTAGGYVYWSQAASFDSEIHRADLDSLNSESIAESPSARGITLDTTNEKIYWADLSNDGAIYVANLDGSESEVLIAGESDGVTNGILDVDLDVENEKLYWVKQGAVMQANLDGTEVSILAEMTSYIQPGSIVVDTEAGFVYWTDSSNDEIRRVSIEGGDTETISDADTPAAVDIDAAAGKIYWVEDYLFSGKGGAIYRANLDGTEVELIKEISFTRNALYVAGWSIFTSNENQNESDIPGTVQLMNNYPNPFNPQTVIRYELNEAMSVTLNVYNFLGQKVSSLIKEEVQNSGSHNVTFDASNLPSGTYYYRIETEAGNITKKMTLIK